MFYPGSAGTLKATVERHLEPAPASGPVPRALVVPHAGYVYSGPVAGKAYSRIVPAYNTIRTVLLLGPSHRIPFRGLALSSASAFRTPLGLVPVERKLCDTLSALSAVYVFDAAHAQEHSLEVQLPFLQVVLANFSIVPVVTGEATAADVAQLIEAFWPTPASLVIISTDLSHYLTYEQARATDESTARAIESFAADEIDTYDACGAVGLRGMLLFAKRQGLTVERIDARNSGDTAGPKDRVVGYGAFAFYE